MSAKLIGTIILCGFLVVAMPAAEASMTASDLAFIMVHLEAGWQATIDNQMPPRLTPDVFPEKYRLMPFGWQEFFWPSVVDLIEEADARDIKISLAPCPQWAIYILADEEKTSLVHQWQANGHEICLQHHSFTHIDWDGYSNNESLVDHPLYRGDTNEAYALVSQLAVPDTVVSATIYEVQEEYPTLMDIPGQDVVLGGSNELDTYPPHTTTTGFVPYRIQRDDGGYKVHFFIFGLTTNGPPMEIQLEGHMDAYLNLADDEVYGVVFHGYDYFLEKDVYLDLFDFIIEQGGSVGTMQDTAAAYDWEGSVAAGLTCTPTVGTLPLTVTFSVTLTNRYQGQARRLAARINVTLAGGASFSNWRSGYTNVDAGASHITAWNQNLPAQGSLLGDNVFQVLAEDVTPPPYNQPPYPAAGDTATDSCIVTGVAP